jgi:ABC-type ATPase involved in cell division
MPVRIYDIAKKLGIENKQVLAKASELGIASARVASSSLDRITGEYLESQLRDELAAAFRRGLRGIALGNFKAFADTQNVPLRPLTLVFGANSSGKSSVLHGLLLARHAADTGELDVSRTEIGGDSVDLGGFRQYVHRREVGRRVEWAAELDVGTLRGQAHRTLEKHKATKVTVTFGSPVDDKGQLPIPGMPGKVLANERPWLISYEVEAGGEVVVRLSRRPDGTMHVDRLDRQVLQPLVDGVLMSHTTAEKIESAEDATAIEKAVEELIPTLRFTAQGLLPERLLGEQYGLSAAPQLVPIQKGERLPQLIGAAQLFIPKAIAELVLGINAAVRAQLGRIRYLGPLRSFPPRHLAFSDDRGRNWLAGGGYAWDVVRTDAEVRNAVNRWLGAEVLKTRYQLQIRTLGPMDALEDPLAEAIEGLPIEVVEEGYGPGHDSHGHEHDGEPPVFGVKDPQAEAGRFLELLRERVGEKYDELVLMDLRSNTAVTHRDVGIGISQVLPVLVHAYADRGQVVAIEQPEIHLHPELQAELGDVFIEAALGERQNTFLLETHSEHLILRIMRRIRETHAGTLPKGATPIKKKDVSILFVEPDGARCIVREMPLNERGELAKAWPGGFFEEGLREVLP